ncbi:glycosyltransferase family 4 protein [Pontibacter locisalis]|uniref:Glycosyltransferase family 4 protein n=1 Tax=Pontibacter locisalis TaxID=1719035 RepID=A0ABW5IQ09_9BACT
MSEIIVSFFFRKPGASFHSIETLFDTIISNLPSAKANKFFLPYKSASPLKLLQNSFYAGAKQAQVNHITGDVNYLGLFLNKKRTILTIHDIESLKSRSRFKNVLLRLFWLHFPVGRLQYITVVSEHSKKQLLSVTKVSADKVVVIPNCVPFSDKDFLPKETINKECPVLLQIGTKSNKNLENLVKAIKGLSCRLIILGGLSDAQVSLMKSSGIVFKNYVSIPYEEVVELYYKADIVTFISFFEGFGLPILEANALGRPVITSNVASMPEVAGDGAILVDPHSPKNIKDAILKLVGDDDFRNSLVQAGYRNVQRFKPEVIAAKYEELYKRILKECV